MYQAGAVESMPYDTKPETGSPFSKVSHVTVGAGEGGQRLDNWLVRVLKGVPKTRIYRDRKSTRLNSSH